MNITDLFLVALLCMTQILGGAVLALWAYYKGSKQENPVPSIRLPSKVSLFRRRGDTNGEATQADIPQSVRRA